MRLETLDNSSLDRIPRTLHSSLPLTVHLRCYLRLKSLSERVFGLIFHSILKFFSFGLPRSKMSSSSSSSSFSLLLATCYRYFFTIFLFLLLLLVSVLRERDRERENERERASVRLLPFFEKFLHEIFIFRRLPNSDFDEKASVVTYKTTDDETRVNDRYAVANFFSDVIGRRASATKRTEERVVFMLFLLLLVEKTEDDCASS